MLTGAAIKADLDAVSCRETAPVGTGKQVDKRIPSSNYPSVSEFTVEQVLTFTVQNQRDFPGRAALAAIFTHQGNGISLRQPIEINDVLARAPAVMRPHHSDLPPSRHHLLPTL